MAEVVFPESFYCPITAELMQDPVMDPEGNTYERSAIEQWLRQEPSSPITRSPLVSTQLIPNRALRDAIQDKIRDFQAANPSQPLPSAPVSRVPRPATPPPPAEVLPPPGPVPIALPPSNANEPPPPSAQNQQATPAAAVGADPVDLVVSAARAGRDEVLLHASISPGPGGAARAPVDVVCVVDISGSMGTEASIKTGSGARESHGLSLLDVVKHAVKTVVHSLQPHDRFALVTFSTTAKTVFKLTPLTDGNKKNIDTKVDQLVPDDTTNLWDGLRTGLDILQEAGTGNDRMSALFLLTDGLPNISPPRGELAMLKRYKDSTPLNSTINTFGFGYAIDTPLLVSLAQEGHGMHSFIPDASFVGTAFVNAVSNLLVTMAKQVTLSVELKEDAKILEVIGHPYKPASWGVTIDLCSLQYGQTKDVVVRLSVPANADASLAIASATAKFNQYNVGAQERTAECKIAAVNTELEVQHLRLAFVSTVAVVLEQMHGNRDKLAAAALTDIEELVRRNQDPRMKALLEDIKGQVREAVKKTPENYYEKWGKHYLPSLARAHLLQQCNNFKDPGIQVYGGKMFQHLRDETDAIFCKLPPPKPSVRAAPPTSSFSSSSSHGGGNYRRSAASSMNMYHNSAGPCFAGEGMVLLANGSEKQVRHIQKGDKVATSPTNSTTFSEVVAVVKTHCLNGKDDLVTLPSGLRVTPFHPVRDCNGNWQFPVDLAPLVRDVECEAVYSFVLKGETHEMVIQGTQCVTLGHGIQGDKVVSHSYFGTQRIVEDLQKMRGWESGLVELFPEFCEGGKCMARDKETGLVCGFAAGANGVPARREP